jgi:outer membrane protein insertion porin family
LGLLCLGAVALGAQPSQSGQPGQAGQATQQAQEQVGPPAPAQGPLQQMPRVVAIQVDGQRRYTSEQLIAALGQRVGEPLDPLAVDAGIKRLWRSFRVNAEVDVVELEPAEPGAPTGEVELLLHVVEMPSDIEPRFLGNDAIDLDTLRKWALLEERTELYLHQALRVRQRLLEGYRREGFHWAEVNVVTRGEDEQSAALSDVIFEIREGPKVRVRAFEIHGNRSMPDTRSWLFFKDGLSHLAKRELKGPALTNWWRGEPFVEEVLQADLLAMRQVYRDRGWLDAVVEVERLDFNPERNRVTVHVRVDEGPRYIVRSLSIEALDVVKKDDSEELQPVDLLIPSEELLALCKLQAGQFFEQTTLSKDREALRLAYGDRGHLDHPSLKQKPFERGYSFEFLEPATVFDLERREVDVIYRLVQGRPLRIREISFSGSSHTRDRVLRREVSIFPGTQADLREINKSLARIQGTGYFSDQMNQLEHREPFYRFTPVPGAPDEVDLEFQVEEGRVIDFQISGGVDSNEGAFGLISLTMRNFDLADTPRSFWGTFGEVYTKEAYHGAGQLLEIELSPGTELSRYRLRFLEPDLFRTHLNPISLDVDLTKRLRAYRTHDEDRNSYALRLGRKFGQDLSAAVGFTWTEVDVDDLDDPAVPPLLFEQNQQAPTVVAGPTFDLSLRDLDNYVAPRQGFSVRWDNAFNDEAFGGDYDFVDSQVHWDGYRPIGTKADGTRIVAHLGIDGGVGAPYGQTDDVPYTERFFIGGSRIMRGFAFRGIGPVDELSGHPLGGETYVTLSGEIYYPLHSVTQPGTYERREMLRATLFTDWGVLDPDAFELDPSEVRGSVGFGFGLAFPIPLTLNFGFPVVYEDVDRTQVFSFSIALF